jgi:hypothetical protein
MVHIKWGRVTEQEIQAMGFKQYTFKEYRSMGHSSCDEVIYLNNTVLYIHFFCFVFRKWKM